MSNLIDTVFCVERLNKIGDIPCDICFKNLKDIANIVKHKKHIKLICGHCMRKKDVKIKVQYIKQFDGHWVMTIDRKDYEE